MQPVAKRSGFTGWHMLSIMVAFFGTIITVNVTMAFYANSSWSGMLSKNTYVASQDFNIKAAEAREWARQGFRGNVRVDENVISYFLEGPADKISQVESVSATMHRPVGEDEDFRIELRRSADGSYSAPHGLLPGPWIIDIEAKSHDLTVFHEAERVIVKEHVQ
jgi:nitrogen fixation protein FixH